MSNQNDAVVVFTARSPERIVREGGSQAWKLNAANVKQCNWLVCTQNRHNSNVEFSDATEPHGSAFLVGKVSGVRKVEGDRSGERWLIAISECARISLPNVWQHWRNPVHYTTLEQLGISLEGLAFQPVPETSHTTPMQEVKQSGQHVATLTIPEAKKALAATLDVPVDAIEITIRS